MINVPHDTELIDDLDQQLGESEALLHALIFIAENAEDNQVELLRHSTVTLAWCVCDKLRLAIRDATRLAA